MDYCRFVKSNLVLPFSIVVWKTTLWDASWWNSFRYSREVRDLIAPLSNPNSCKKLTMSVCCDSFLRPLSKRISSRDYLQHLNCFGRHQLSLLWISSRNGHNFDWSSFYLFFIAKQAIFVAMSESSLFKCSLSRWSCFSFSSFSLILFYSLNSFETM